MHSAFHKYTGHRSRLYNCMPRIDYAWLESTFLLPSPPLLATNGVLRITHISCALHMNSILQLYSTLSWLDEKKGRIFSKVDENLSLDYSIYLFHTIRTSFRFSFFFALLPITDYENCCKCSNTNTKYFLIFVLFLWGFRYVYNPVPNLQA